MGFLRLRPFESKIRDENARLFKMLLMIPIEVIDNVAVVKDFLENGIDESYRGYYRSGRRGLLEENNARNKAAVDYSVDAVVVVNTLEKVDLFNPAAERLWGYPASEVSNKC